MTDNEQTLWEKFSAAVHKVPAGELSIAEKLELWRVLNTPVFLKVIKTKLEIIDQRKDMFLKYNLSDPEHVVKASTLQGSINGFIETLSGLIDESLDKEPKDDVI